MNLFNYTKITTFTLITLLITPFAITAGKTNENNGNNGKSEQLQELQDQSGPFDVFITHCCLAEISKEKLAEVCEPLNNNNNNNAVNVTCPFCSQKFASAKFTLTSSERAVDPVDRNKPLIERLKQFQSAQANPNPVMLLMTEKVMPATTILRTVNITKPISEEIYNQLRIFFGQKAIMAINSYKELFSSNGNLSLICMPNLNTSDFNAYLNHVNTTIFTSINTKTSVLFITQCCNKLIKEEERAQKNNEEKKCIHCQKPLCTVSFTTNSPIIDSLNEEELTAMMSQIKISMNAVHNIHPTAATADNKPIVLITETKTCTNFNNYTLKIANMLATAAYFSNLVTFLTTNGNSVTIPTTHQEFAANAQTIRVSTPMRIEQFSALLKDANSANL